MHVDDATTELYMTTTRPKFSVLHEWLPDVTKATRHREGWWLPVVVHTSVVATVLDL